VQKTISNQNRVWSEAQAQAQMLNIHNCLLFSHDQLDVAFCQSSLFDNVTAAVTEGYRQPMKNCKLIT
jgi:hypothetical protein